VYVYHALFISINIYDIDYKKTPQVMCLILCSFLVFLGCVETASS
jgi:hypothetical protein